MHVAICGGTGPIGGGFARRLRLAGHKVSIGSRELAKAQAAVSELAASGVDGVIPVTNDDACRDGEIIVIAVPWEGAEALVRAHADALAAKIVISTVNALSFVSGRPMPLLPPTGSIGAALQLAAPRARIVTAFQHIPAADLGAGARGDVLVCGDDAGARAAVIELIGGFGELRGVDAGELSYASAVEAFTTVLLRLNQIHKGRARPLFTGLRSIPG